MENLPGHSASETAATAENQPLGQSTDHLLNTRAGKDAADGKPERPDIIWINMANFNAREQARRTIVGNDISYTEIYLIASKDFEEDNGYFRYYVQAYEGMPEIEGGDGAWIADNEVMPGLFGSVGSLTSFIDENPEIWQAVERLGGNIAPLNQQYGYGFKISKYPEHEIRPDDFII